MKCGVLVIGAAFFVFLRLEVLSRRSFHSVRYLLAGAALVIFYVLLLSFAGHMGFATVSERATAAVVGIVSIYVVLVFRWARKGAIVTGQLTFAYGLLSVILRAEDLALLADAVTVFLALAAAMMLTARTDWVALGKAGAGKLVLPLTTSWYSGKRHVLATDSPCLAANPASRRHLAVAASDVTSMTVRSFASHLPVDRSRSFALLLVAATALAGCASSERFSGTIGALGPSGSQRLDDTFRRDGQGEPAPLPARRPSAVDQDVIPGGQTNEAVSAEEIPAEPPRAGDTRPSAIEPALGPQGVPPGTPGVGATANAVAGAGAPAAASQTPTAALPARPEIPRQERPSAAAPRGDALSAVTGTWTVSDAGDRCRITLTSAPLFEFYRASPQNCRARTLSRINAWEQRGNEIVLMQPGGTIAARLSPDGSGYAGAMASGAPVTMTR